jgi:hypothetical protein
VRNETKTNQAHRQNATESRSAGRFFRTKTGAQYKDDLVLAAHAALKGIPDLWKSHDVALVVTPRILKDPGFQAARVLGLLSAGAPVAAVFGEFQEEMLSSKLFSQVVLTCRGDLLYRFPQAVRSRREDVLWAVENHPAALRHATDLIWRKDTGQAAFFVKLLCCGCSAKHFPTSLWADLWEDRYSVCLAANVLLKRRDLWVDLPEVLKAKFPECLGHQCSTCFELPEEVYNCVGGCLNYVCKKCSDSLAKHAREQGVRPRCPTCREDRHCGDFFGARNRDAEKLVKMELELASKEGEFMPSPKRRRKEEVSLSPRGAAARAASCA